jgi:hypothetical protein
MLIQLDRRGRKFAGRRSGRRLRRASSAKLLNGTVGLDGNIQLILGCSYSKSLSLGKLNNLMNFSKVNRLNFSIIFSIIAPRGEEPQALRQLRLDFFCRRGDAGRRRVESRAGGKSTLLLHRFVLKSKRIDGTIAELINV